MIFIHPVCRAYDDFVNAVQDAQRKLTLRERIKDAWAVVTGRAEAVMVLPLSVLVPKKTPQDLGGVI